MRWSCEVIESDIKDILLSEESKTREHTQRNEEIGIYLVSG